MAKAYRNIHVRNVNPQKLDKAMNDMAKEGWIVHTVHYYGTWPTNAMITFEKERDPYARG